MDVAPDSSPAVVQTAVSTIPLILRERSLVSYMLEPPKPRVKITNDPVYAFFDMFLLPGEDRPVLPPIPVYSPLGARNFVIMTSCSCLRRSLLTRL